MLPVLPLPVDGHGGVRAEGVVHHAGLVALEGDAEEAHRAAAHRLHRELRLPVVDVDRVDARGLRVGAGGEALRRGALHLELHVAALRLLQVVEIEARHAPPIVSARRCPESRDAAAVAREGDAAQAVHSIGRGGPGEAARFPLSVGRVKDVVVEVPLPWVRNEDEPVPRVPEARLQAAADGARDVVARDGRVPVVKDARDGARLLRVGPAQARVERVEGVAAGVVDRDGPQRRLHLGIDVGQGGARLGGERVVHGRVVLRGGQGLLAGGDRHGGGRRIGGRLRGGGLPRGAGDAQRAQAR